MCGLFVTIAHRGFTKYLWLIKIPTNFEWLSCGSDTFGTKFFSNLSNNDMNNDDPGDEVQ